MMDKNGQDDAAREERGASELLGERKDDSSARAARVKKEIREWVISLAVALVAVFLIRMFLFTVIRVEGPSMQETLKDGDRMIVTIIDKTLFGAKRSDVVICRYPDRTDRFVKRVVGVSGDVLEISDGVLYVNGEPIDEPYVTHKPSSDYGPVTVPEGSYFVMGDNRSNSRDSRSPEVGPIQADMIVGIARFVMWPFSEFGPVGGW